jgi:hypothetical protein
MQLVATKKLGLGYSLVIAAVLSANTAVSSTFGFVSEAC